MKADENAPPATADTAAMPTTRRSLFRRFVLLYLLASIFVAAVIALVGRQNLRGISPQLVVVLLIYWSLPVPVVRVILEWKRLWKKVLLAITSTTVFTVTCLELAGCILYPPRTVLTFKELGVASRRFHHALPPNERAVLLKRGEETIYVETNEDGFRTGHARAAFRQYDHRIVVLGDSYVFGYRLAAEESIPGQLEAMIREARPGRSVGVLNAGIISYSPLLEHQVFLDKAGHYRPRITLLCLDVTDVGDDYGYAQEDIGRPGDLHFPFPEAWTRPREPPQRVSMTLRVLEATNLTLPLEALIPGSFTPDALDEPDDRYDYYRFSIEIGGALERNRFFVMRHPLSQTRPYFESTYRHVLAIREACRRIGSAFVLVLLPRPFHWNVDEAPRNVEVELQYYAGNEPHIHAFFEFFEPRAGEDGIRVLNLLPVFARSEEFPLCFLDDPHYNPSGCRVAARGIFDYLQTENLLD